MVPRRIWLLTGEPGVGKTTIITEVVRTLRTHGLVVGGVISRENRARGLRVGFELLDLGSGRQGILASATMSTGPRLGRYRVNLKDLAEIGARALSDAVTRSDVVVCDEIGPMELFSPEFRRAIKVVVSSDKPVLGVIHRRMSDPLIDEVRGLDSTEVIEVSEDNRPHLANDIAEQILAFAKTRGGAVGA